MSRGIYKKIYLLLMFVFFLCPFFVGAQATSTLPVVQDGVVSAIKMEKDGKGVYTPRLYQLEPHPTKPNVFRTKGQTAEHPEYTIQAENNTNYIVSETSTKGGRKTNLTPNQIAADKQKFDTIKQNLAKDNNAAIAILQQRLSNQKLTNTEKSRIQAEIKKLEQANSRINGLSTSELLRVKATNPTVGTSAPNSDDSVEIECEDWIDPMCWLANLSFHFILGMSNRLFTMIGNLFDIAINKSVVEMGSTLGLAGEEQTANAINIGWVMFRDLANIIFIFVLLYASIRTIISGTGDTGQTIVNVIVVAVLINFSMFFTKVVIDVSNTLAISFYNSIHTYSVNYATTKSTQVQDPNKPISVLSPLLDQSLVMSLAKNIQQEVLISKNTSLPLNYGAIIRQSLMGAVLILLLTFIIASMGIMLLARIVVLGFVIMTSSLAFGAYILPGLREKVTDRWWSTLISQAFFAPVFLLLLFISVQFIGVFGESNKASLGYGASLNNLLPVDGSSAAGIIQFIIAASFLWISLSVAKNMANSAGGYASKITGGIGKFALGTAALAGGAAAYGSRKVVGGTLGGVGALTRATVGRGGAALADSKWASQLANNPNSRFKRFAGRTLQRTGDVIAEKQFDPRNLPGAGKLKNVIGTADGKGGFRQATVDAGKREKERAARSAQATQEEIREKTAHNDEIKKHKGYLDDMAKDDKVVELEEKIKKDTEDRAEARQKLSALKTMGKGRNDKEFQEISAKIRGYDDAITNNDAEKKKAQSEFLKTKSDGKFTEPKMVKEHIKKIEKNIAAIDDAVEDREKAAIKRFENSASSKFNIDNIASGWNINRIMQSIKNKK